MARTYELPPPPENPVRSPPVQVAGEELIRLASPGADLEARVRARGDETRAIVICHPHPLYGGSMHSPVPLAIAKKLGELTDVAHLRFSFRGVPPSTGTYDKGHAEVDDALAAIAELRHRVPSAKISLCGHSFGSWVGLKAAGRDGQIERVALVAPSIRFFQFKSEDKSTFDGPLHIFIGDQDEFADMNEAQSLAKMLDAGLSIFEGFDHHFLKSRRVIAEAVVRFLI